MRSRNTLIAVVALALVLVLAGAAAAGRGPWRDERGREAWGCDGPRQGHRDCDGPRGRGRDCDGPCGGDRDCRGEGPCGGVLCDGPRSLFGPWDLGGLRALDLTREQREKVRDLLEKRRDETRQAWDRLGDLREDLGREILAAKPDEGKVKELSRKLGEAASEAALLAVRVAGELKGVLTPEQQARLDEARRGPDERDAPRQERRHCR